MEDASGQSFTLAAYCGDGYGNLIPLISGSFHFVAVDSGLIVGVGKDNFVYPIYNAAREQIVVRISDQEKIVMDERLHEEYDHVFIRFRVRPRSRSAPPRLRNIGH